MRQVQTDRDLAEMLAERRAVLFVFVNWSEYARRGQDICIQAESHLQSTPSKCSWWIADISSIDSPPNPSLHRWLTDQEQKSKIGIFPGIALGNGSVVWMKSGKIVKFEPNAERSGLEVLIQFTEGVSAA